MKHNIFQAAFLVLGVSMLGSAARAAVSADEAKQLGTTLTPLGGEVAGNKEGSIPAYTGGLKALPAGVKAAQDGKIANPFPGEKPLYSIDAKNMAQYADKLADSVQYMMKKYPTFRIDVYPSHRTASAPDSVYQATLANATKATSDPSGDGFDGARGGVPFPIPKNAYEVMWNFIVRPKVAYEARTFEIWSVDASGTRTYIARNNFWAENMWGDPARVDEAVKTGIFQTYRVPAVAPARQAGNDALAGYCMDFRKCDQTTYIYTPGQRRVRLAPELKYDTPITTFGGLVTGDETDGVWGGRMDRFDWKLVGKKEMIVPYNAADFAFNITPESKFTPNHYDPATLRWELHRVWVLDATLKAGKRHTASKKRFLFDEDSWAGVISDSWDASGAIYRSSWSPFFQDYRSNMPQGDVNNLKFDFSKGNYAVSGDFGCDACGLWKLDKLPSPDTMTPQGMLNSGVR
jgi:hypothetical protein